MRVIFQELNEGDLLNPKHLFVLWRYCTPVGLVMGKNKEDALRELVNHHSKFSDLVSHGDDVFVVTDKRDGSSKWVLGNGWFLRRLKFV